jgi:nucleoside-diphosphate-sugar epimerase
MYLITGGAGFIGSSVACELARYQQRVRILDNFSTGRRENLQPLAGRVEVIEGDVRDLAAVRRAMTGVRYVLHHAAVRSIPRTVQGPGLTTEVNVLGTLNVLVAARQARVERVVYGSSSSVYGDSQTRLQDEEQRAAPLSPYAVSKLAGELYCRLFSRLYELDTVCLRYFNVFGPGPEPELEHAPVIPRFTLLALRAEPLEVHGDGLQSRDFTYISDVVQANLLAATAPNVRGEVFNVGGGETYPVIDVVLLLSQILGREIPWRRTAPRKGDVRRTQADISKARRLLGYEVEVEFPIGLARTVKHFMAASGAARALVGEAR